MQVLVDTSVWIDYLRSGKHSGALDDLIDKNMLVTNDIILAELIPYLKIRKQTGVIQLLHAVKRVPLRIDWEHIIALQINCLKNGANGVGIPDLIIVQNAMDNNTQIYTLDKHFSLLCQIVKLKLYQQ